MKCRYVFIRTCFDNAVDFVLIVSILFSYNEQGFIFWELPPLLSILCYMYSPLLILFIIEPYGRDSSVYSLFFQLDLGSNLKACRPPDKNV